MRERNDEWAVSGWRRYLVQIAIITEKCIFAVARALSRNITIELLKLYSICTIYLVSLKSDNLIILFSRFPRYYVRE